MLDRPGRDSYHAWIAEPALEGQSPAADFTVAPPPGEFAQVRMDAAEMRRAAAADRRPVLHLRHGRPAAAATCRPAARCRSRSLPPVPLWNRWPVLALFLGLLIAEWILRKLRGMV